MAKGKDYTTAHNLVVVDTALRVAVTASATANRAFGTLSMDFGDFVYNLNSDGTVSIDVAPPNMNIIPGAAKNGKGGKGRADLMLKTTGPNGKQKVYIWEIKAAKDAGDAPAQLQRYIRNVKGGGGTEGWWLPDSFIPDGNSSYIWAYSRTNTKANPVGNGIRLYEDGGNPKNSRNGQPPGPGDWIWGFAGLGGLLGGGAGISTGGGSGRPQPTPRPVPVPQLV